MLRGFRLPMSRTLFTATSNLITSWSVKTVRFRSWISVWPNCAEYQARLDGDGVFRGVIAHRDPGVPNWLDCAGQQQGSIAARFLLAESAPEPALRRVPWGELRSQLPAETPRVEPAEREALLARRRRAVWRRYRR